MSETNAADRTLTLFMLVKTVSGSGFAFLLTSGLRKAVAATSDNMMPRIVLRTVLQRPEHMPKYCTGLQLVGIG